MGRARPAASQKKKRSSKSTLQALDLLNNVNRTTASRSRVARRAASRRQSSLDIYEIPPSDGESVDDEQDSDGDGETEGVNAEQQGEVPETPVGRTWPIRRSPRVGKYTKKQVSTPGELLQQYLHGLGKEHTPERPNPKSTRSAGAIITTRHADSYIREEEEEHSSLGDTPADLDLFVDYAPIEEATGARRFPQHMAHVEIPPMTRGKPSSQGTAGQARKRYESDDSESGGSSESDSESSDDERSTERSSDEDEEEEAWFEEAKKLGGQEENWAALMTKARQLKAGKPSSLHVFSASDMLIRVLSDVYETLAVQRSQDENGDCSSHLRRESKNLVQTLSDETYGILAKVLELATEGGSPGGAVNATNLLTEFEQYTLPRIVRLSKTCFKAHYLSHTSGAEGSLARKAAPHLLRVLDLLAGLLTRTYNLCAEGFVPQCALSAAMRLPLRRLIAAVRSGKLGGDRREAISSRRGMRKRSSLDDGLNASILESRHDSLVITGIQKVWTDEEGRALLDGLKQYQGPDRYIQIMRVYGHRLRGRTIADLQTQTERIRADLRRKYPEAQWAWLFD
ncbi:hypothetical protein ASPZODRAFT_134016 [Penicilliopsis zonata CBS 506.65]|uniref:Uncharacterized protein n=1 Tax=Penicilliopsis zonata CBS 506.65 TaxID=1073090 RepID=A0A1L9SDS9_9EURO|nr:hypothetical protein ASPZODRAFT_134016 [Penicilliopsis zonata CBS 506.65]OJJ45370.1 hypothetical protein ASPZODRAFT_134016 [Penicilliopsis zonata CBS 506.65]